MPRLQSIAEALHPALSRVERLSPTVVATGDALGRILVAPALSPRPAPERSVALRSGFAVNALDVVGASAQSPLLMTQAPVRVALGEPLPAGCDAVLAPASAVENGAFLEITQGAAPGEGVRLAGHDLAGGAIIVEAGAVVTPSLQLALRLAGTETLTVIVPRVSIDFEPSPTATWLAVVLGSLGCEVAEGSADDAHLALRWTDDGEPRLALNPGETAFVGWTPGAPIEIGLPQRFDGLVAAFAALVLPVLSKLSGRAVQTVDRRLARKVTSAVGSSDVVLLKIVDAGYLPLSAGEITLASLAAADAVALLPPESEGLPAGALLSAIPLNAMLDFGRPS